MEESKESRSRWAIGVLAIPCIIGGIFMLDTHPLWAYILFGFGVLSIVWGIWPLIRRKRQTKPNATLPEISIQIDNCSWSNPERIGNEPMRIIEVALTLNVQNPPVNVTALQLYIEDGLQQLVDSSPSIPFTQETTKGCYIARFGFSYSSPNFVVSNEVKKYQLRVIAKGQSWTSIEFSPKDFSPLSSI